MLGKSRSFLLVSAFVFLALSTAWIAGPPGSPAAQPPTPGEPPESVRTLEDSDSSLRAEEHRILSGDNFLNNLYERPFTSQEMVYQPELDILTVDFSYDDTFFYFTITLNGMEFDKGIVYGIEFDRRLEGRGDLLVQTTNLPDEWSSDGIVVWKDRNGSVGGLNPMVAEEGYEGDGYDQQVEMNDEQIAYARLSPDDPHAVQFAVSRALLDNPEEFLYGAWVDNGLKDVTLFDYNDAFGLSDAGSPFKDDDDYPINALFSLDSTCRLPYGFEQSSESIPGMCINVAPAPAGCVRVCLEYLRLTCIKWGCKK